MREHVLKWWLEREEHEAESRAAFHFQMWFNLDKHSWKGSKHMILVHLWVSLNFQLTEGNAHYHTNDNLVIKATAYIRNMPISKTSLKSSQQYCDNIFVALASSLTSLFCHWLLLHLPALYEHVQGEEISNDSWTLTWLYSESTLWVQQ